MTVEDDLKLGESGDAETKSVTETRTTSKSRRAKPIEFVLLQFVRRGGLGQFLRQGQGLLGCCSSDNP